MAERCPVCGNFMKKIRENDYWESYECKNNKYHIRNDKGLGMKMVPKEQN